MSHAVLALACALAAMSPDAPSASPAAPSSAPSRAAPASRPASANAAASLPEYPPPELVVACRTAAGDIGSRLDGSFKTIMLPPFVVSGNVSEGDLRQYARESIVRPAEVMWRSYFAARPDKPITILLFADDKSYRSWANKLFDDTDVSHYGYYKPSQQTMLMNIGTGTGTLVHELTHALIVYDFPDHPAWFNEGLGSLHEQCSVEANEVRGMVNWRLPGLQQAISAGKLQPLTGLVAMADDDFYGDDRGVNYAQARYLCMYLQQRGVLGRFYQRMRAAKGTPDAAVAALEQLLDKKIGQIDKDYVAWVKTLRF